mmetsp:Transcript_160019/g.513408  ORF Transcript_160019/g.513408 Transcript_160019/m.513408 type:complete len:129 (+) Transcript_160019:92-478(+)
MVEEGSSGGIHEYSASRWVQGLRFISGEADFPLAGASVFDWGGFLLSVGAAPLALTVVGLTAVLCLHPLLWCLRPKTYGSRPAQTPSLWPFAAALAVVAVALGVEGCFSLQEVSSSFENVLAELELAI